MACVHQKTPIVVRSSVGSEFDTDALSQRAFLWRIEAVRAPAGPMRNYCLNEAKKCERRLRRSFETPIISGWIQVAVSLQQLVDMPQESAAQLEERENGALNASAKVAN